jgi:hypothetical protein
MTATAEQHLVTLDDLAAAIGSPVVAGGMLEKAGVKPVVDWAGRAAVPETVAAQLVAERHAELEKHRSAHLRYAVYLRDRESDMAEVVAAARKSAEAAARKSKAARDDALAAGGEGWGPGGFPGSMSLDPSQIQWATEQVRETLARWETKHPVLSFEEWSKKRR